MMFEKMVLIGLMGLWSPSITQKAANVLISTISIVMIAWHIPSKTHECKSPRITAPSRCLAHLPTVDASVTDNYANLLSRMCIVLTFMSTIVIKSEQENFTDNDEVAVNVVLFATQGVVMVYCLLVVSLRNLKKMVKEVRWPLLLCSSSNHHHLLAVCRRKKRSTTR